MRRSACRWLAAGAAAAALAACGAGDGGDRERPGSAVEARASAAAAAAAAIEPPPVVCSPPEEWREVERTEVGDDAGLILAGIVRAGDPTITLAPATCDALAGVLAAPRLACLADDGERCERAAVEAAFALVTLAHEAQHVAGVEDEAVAQCYALQRVGAVAVAFGVPAEEAARIGEFVRHTDSMPPAYTSPECRAGGSLDLEPERSSFP